MRLSANDKKGRGVSMESEAINLASPVVLAIDDDEQSLHYIRRNVRDIDAELIECKNGAEALDQLGRTEFALAIIDIALPDIDGFKIAARMREKAINADLPFLFLTGNPNSLARVARGYELGAVDFLEKFINPDALRAKVLVFVEIFRRQKLLLQQEREQQRLIQEHKERAGYVRRLEELLARYREMSTHGSYVSTSRTNAIERPLRDRTPESFRQLSKEYESLLERYMEQLVVSVPKPVREMTQLAHVLGNHGGGPRDLLDIHLSALEAMVQRSSARRAEAYSVEGRLIALEMMGLLADFYRVGAGTPMHLEN